jgi:hypothetical protein
MISICRMWNYDPFASFIFVFQIVNFVIDYFAPPLIICANHRCWNVSGKPYGMLVSL